MAFVDKVRVVPTIFFMEKISFSLKLFSGYFYGQSFIKTVRGPLFANRNTNKIRKPAPLNDSLLCTLRMPSISIIK